MPKSPGRAVENLLSNIVETFSHNVQKKKALPFYKENQKESSRKRKIFQRQSSGKSADVFSWRNKKISSGVLAAASSIWTVFEWLDYNLLSLTCFLLVIGMFIQFVWFNASGFLNRSPSDVPRLVLPDEIFVNMAVTISAQVNRFLGFLQDVSCGGNLKQFFVVVMSLFTAAFLGSSCDFLTFIYIGFVAVHTLPVLYEKYEDQVNSIIYILIEQLQKQFHNLENGVLGKIPKHSKKGRKSK